MSKALVACFSASGVTAKLAKALASATDADLFEIKPVTPCTSKDLNWMDKTSRSTIEMQDKSSRPEMAETLSSCAQYDTVFVGFPIWWYEAPHIIETFLESCDLSGKTVVPFATSGGSSMGKTAKILAPSCPGATVLDGKVLRAVFVHADGQLVQLGSRPQGVGFRSASGITIVKNARKIFPVFAKFYPPGELKIRRAV